uniref:Uncharacterized protein n=1 Tax=Globisporangium ultimum (strain ATCC 200006 / CBS 805.95 / DAOM BR144) TaxID=431595 RepID=K3X7E2_GLOUD
MSMNQHFKKRKSRTSSASGSRRIFGCGNATTIASASSTTATLTSVDMDPVMSKTETVSSAPSNANESASLAAALTALQVSLSRDFESFTPPTPAASPVHGRSAAKRARFDFPAVDECEPVSERQGKVSPAPKARGALLAVSNRIKLELEKHLRKNSERSQRPRKRKQLSYFAILGAFHQAVHERDVALKIHSLDRA